jgi:predicted nucleic acid-binding protein
MILVDTSVWVDHFRNGNAQLKAWLNDNEVVVHPFVIGELACGSLRNRSEILNLLSELPEATVAQHDEVLSFVENNRLYGTGIGWIDAHLVASALLSKSKLMTLDKPLLKIASILGLQPLK